MNVKTLNQPWYKEPWPWILMAGPGLVIVAGAITIWLAIVSFDGMVEDDYYKQGLAVNQRIHRDRAAHDLGFQAQVVRSGAELRVFLSSSTGAAMPEQLALRLVHPTRGGMDQTIALANAGQGFYSGRLDVEVDGRWHVFLEDPDFTWRLLGDWQFNDDAPLFLQPQH